MGQHLFQFAKRHVRPVIGIFIAACIWVAGILMNAQQIATTVLPGWGWQLVGGGIFLLSILAIMLHWDKEHSATLIPRAPPEAEGAKSDKPSFDDRALRQFRADLRVFALSIIADLEVSYWKCFCLARDLSRQNHGHGAAVSTGFAEMAVRMGVREQFRRLKETAGAQSDTADHSATAAEIVLFLVRYGEGRRIPLMIATEYSVDLGPDLERWRKAQERCRLKLADLLATSYGRDLKEDYAIEQLARFD